jgi:hypothetical protein
MYSAIWVYPWDLIDEGLDASLGRIAEAGLDAISVATAYHSVRELALHNPKRVVVHGEGGVIYFQPDQEQFPSDGLHPVLSSLCEDSDPLADICDAAAKHGLKVHTWTVAHHNTRLGTARPDCCIQNAFGDIYPFGLCPSNPDVRNYTIGLVKCLAARPNVDTIELESLGYMGIDHSGHHSKAGLALDSLHQFLLSICFCSHCAERMAQNGVEVDVAREKITQELRGYFRGNYHTHDEDTLGALTEVLGRDNADGILAARDDSVLSLLEELYWLIQKPQRLSVMVSPSPLTTGALAGITLSQARERCDVLLTQAFQREADRVHAQVSDIAVRRGSTPLYAGLQSIQPFTIHSEDLVAASLAAARAGASGLQFYHYGLMPLENLNWITASLAAVE